jgi:hypothetical protein
LAQATHLEVEVGACAPARAARSADALSRPDPLAYAHAPAGKVRVEAGEAAAVCDLDHVSVALEAARLTDRDDRAGLSRADRERAEDSDVDPRMSGPERGRDRSARRPGRPVGRCGSSRKRRARERKREEEGQHGRGAYSNPVLCRHFGQLFTATYWVPET